MKFEKCFAKYVSPYFVKPICLLRGKSHMVLISLLIDQHFGFQDVWCSRCCLCGVCRSLFPSRVFSELRRSASPQTETSLKSTEGAFGSPLQRLGNDFSNEKHFLRFCAKIWSPLNLNPWAKGSQGRWQFKLGHIGLSLVWLKVIHEHGGDINQIH